MMQAKKWAIPLIMLLAAAAWFAIPGGTAAKEPKGDPALERTRKQIRMLDDLYKTAILLITTHYVNEESDLGAGPAAKALFAAMKEKGWHEVRLLDATGEPYNDENTPARGFEQDAVRALKSGKSYYDRVAERDGKRYLQAATPIPVVLKKCAICHPHYSDVKPGEPIGALAYTLPIE